MRSTDADTVYDQKVEARWYLTSGNQGVYIRANHPAILAQWAYTSSQLLRSVCCRCHLALELSKMSSGFNILVSRTPDASSQRDGGFTAAVISTICGQATHLRKVAGGTARKRTAHSPGRVVPVHQGCCCH
jgi:hypothetical protein